MLISQLQAAAPRLQSLGSRAELMTLLPPGGARNAMDCALWDLEAKRQGRRAWELCSLPRVRSLNTAYTLGVDTPEAMGRSAASLSRYPLLKLKMTGADDLERVSQVRAARPDAGLIVDANQAWSMEQLIALAPAMAQLRVKLIEQPLPPGNDEALARFRSPVPLCADESCQTTNHWLTSRASTSSSTSSSTRRVA